MADLTLMGEEWHDEEDDSVRQGWRIENTQAAEWALKRVAECCAAVESVDADAEQAHRWVDRRAEKVKAPLERTAAFFRFCLLSWMERERHTILKGKAKSKTLLYGRIGWRSPPEKLVYEDEAAALEWAKAQPVELNLVRYEPKLNKDEVKQYAKLHGLTPPGTRWETGEDKPYVEAISPTLIKRDEP